MKNSILYTLIGLMAFALVGSIVIQSLWIYDSVKQKKEELNWYVNEALNDINRKIGEAEAESIIDLKFGGLDSLINSSIEIKEEFEQENTSDKKKGFVVISKSENGDKKVQLNYNDNDSSTVFVGKDSTIIIEKTINEKMHEVHNELIVKMESVHEDIKDHIEWTEGAAHKMENVIKVVEHFTYEKLFSGDISDRIQLDQLSKFLNESLLSNGISEDFDFAVIDERSGVLVEGLYSANYNQQESAYKKRLFPDDKMKGKKYVLNLQIKNSSSYVWKGVRTMIVMSLIFTVLIIFAFSFSIYFIFKQKKMSRVKNDFINNMTHELKTPLASISLAASSIKHPEVIRNESQVAEFVEIIEAEKKRMNSHIEKVLDIAALESGELDLQLSETNLIDLVHNSLTNLKLTIESVEGEVEFNSKSENAIVLGDQFHLVNAITNVLDNSIKYRSNDQLKVIIELEEQNEYYLLKISDNGIGMGKKAQKLAFDRFYREESGNIHNRKGFGLGLSYVQNIILKHNGSVSIQSEKGKGTSVEFIIPKAK